MTVPPAGTNRKASANVIEGQKAGGAESGTGTILTRWGVLDYGSAMPRTARVAPGGMVFHVLNRGVARMRLFEKAADYQAFEQVLQDTLDQSPMRICAYAVMPNHWHQRFPEEPKYLQDKDLRVHYFAKKSLSWYAPNIRP